MNRPSPPSRYRRIVLWAVGGLAFSLFAAVVGGSILYLGAARSKTAQALQDEIAWVRSHNLPLRTEELNHFYTADPSRPDITAELVPLLAQSHNLHIDPRTNGLPFFKESVNGILIVLPEKGEPWVVEKQVGVLLRDFEKLLAVLDKAAQSNATVRFPVVYARPYSESGDHIGQLRECSKLLQLRVLFESRAGNKAQALQSCKTMLQLGHLLDRQPGYFALLVRCSLYSRAFEAILQLTQDGELLDADLEQLQLAIRSVNLKGSLQLAIAGDRAQAYSACCSSLADLLPNNLSLAEELLIKAHDNRALDTARALEVFRRISLANEISADRARQEAIDIEDEFQILFRQDSGARYRYIGCDIGLPAFVLIIDSQSRTIAQRDSLDCLLAVNRFQLANSKVPKSLSELVPKFLPAVPTDLFDNSPMKYVRRSGNITVYSVGLNRKDDGGEIVSVGGSSQPKDFGYSLPAGDSN